MTAGTTHTELLERLGTGDEVFAAETLKAKAAGLAGALATLTDAHGDGTFDERVRAALDPVDEVAEEFLAVIFPVVEYAGGAALNVLPRALAHVARKTSLTETQTSFPFMAATLVAGRLVWSVAAYALHCDRLDGLTAARRAALASGYDDTQPTPLFADPSLRHPHVFTDTPTRRTRTTASGSRRARS